MSSSPDGNTLAAVDMNGYLAVSNDAGDTWAQSGADKTWKDVKVTSDGTLVGIVDSDTAIFTSSDHGDTWTRHPIKASDGSGPPVSFWQSLAITPDGVNVYTYGDIADHRYVYASHDSGVVWERSEKVPSFSKMAVSSDGTRVVATELNGGIYISNDSGITWARRGLDGPWFGIDISPDGQAIIACQYGGYIYTSDDTPTTTVGTAGKLTGIRGDDVMLEYSGSGRFDVLNHAGTLSFE